MSETPKRLTPTSETLRELYLKSGNQCSFPGCSKSIINNEGEYVTQLCHIEAAMPGGERFNPNQVNEERRTYHNLLFLCYEHHIVTDNINVYTVDRMREIKSDHELKYSDPVHKIIEKFIDYSTAQINYSPQSLSELNRVLGWKQTPDELKYNISEMRNFIDKLKKLPPGTRQLMNIIAERASQRDPYNRRYFVLAPEICSACQLDRTNLNEQMAIIEKYGLAHIDEDDNGIPIITLSGLRSGWPIWDDLKKFSSAKNIPLYDLIVNMRFDLLD